MGNYRKAQSITFHSDGYDTPHAAVNVKIYDWRDPDPETVAAELDEARGLEAEFARWWRELPEAEKNQWAKCATEDGWRDIERNAAQNIWPGRKVKVYAEGRSGGWAVPYLDGRALVEADFTDRAGGPSGHACHEHDGSEECAAHCAAAAKLREQFAEFERYAGTVCDNLPTDTQRAALYSGFLPMHEARERQRIASFYYDVATI